MSRHGFAWSAALLERCEALRQPGVVRALPGETVEQRDARVQRDRLHRAVERDNALTALHEQFAASLGLKVSKKAASLAQMIWNTNDPEDHGAMPTILRLLVERSVATVVMRAGQGVFIPNAMLYHVAMNQLEVDRAIGAMKALGLRAWQQPWSFVNPRGLRAVLVKRPAGGEDGR